MSSRARYLVGPVVVGAILALGALSLFGDSLADGPLLSLVFLAFDVRVLLGLAVLIYAVSFLLYLYYLRGEDRSRLVTDGPRVEAIVPVYRDADAMHQSVESLVASTYENLAVTVVDPEGRPVAGATVVVASDTARLDGVATAGTGENGTATVTVAPTLGSNREQGALSISIKPPAGGQYEDRRGNTRVLVVAE